MSTRALPKSIQRITRIAIQIALVAPKQKNRWSWFAQVPWGCIFDLREALTEAGVDLDKMRKAQEAEKKTATTATQRASTDG